MFTDPEHFIKEKLKKKFLSINTIRDGIMAALLLSLQEAPEKGEQAITPETWGRKKASEIRVQADKAFAKIGAPSEYPTLEQLQQVAASLEKFYKVDQQPERQKADFETRCKALFDKFEDNL